MYNKVVKNSQVTYGVPFQLKTPLNYHNIKLQEISLLEPEDTTEKLAVNFSSEMITKAREESEMIIKEAEYEALHITEAAQKTASINSARIEEEAWNKGYSEGIATAVQEYETRIQEAQNIKESTITEHDNVIRCMEKEIIEMTLEISKKVIGAEVQLNQENILLIVRQAIEKCSNRNNMVIKVSQMDYNYVNENTDKLHSVIQGIDGIDIRMDLSLKSGDCIIDTPFGSVDAGVQTKLLKIEEAFRELMEDRIAYNEE